MKATERFLLTLFLVILVCTLATAQNAPIEWGKIPQEDLEMKSFPPDTNASAVILSDYGESFFDDELNIVFTRHRRIKILSPNGYDWGTHSVVILKEKDVERIDQIEGATYSLSDDRQVVVKKLSSDDIFEEDVDGRHSRYRFTLPGLSPGCVVEFRYKIVSQSLFLVRDWIFQHSEPIRWSEYRFRYPSSFSYASVLRGYERFTANKMTEATQVFSGEAAGLLGKSIVPCQQLRWVVQDAPALRDEPFVTTLDDYVNKVDIQLAGYAFPFQPSKRVLETWEKLVIDLYEDENFGEKIDDTRAVRKQAEQITTGLTTPEEKIHALYTWVSNSIVWTGTQRVFAQQDVDDVLDSKKGSNAEITFLLLSLLKSIDIPGDPIILSTRGNGEIQDLYPILNQFNYVLARVVSGSKTYYLDATDPFRPIDLLPAKVLNVKGLVIKKSGVEWVTFDSPKKYLTASTAHISLLEDATVNATVETAYEEYSGVQIRKDIQDADKEKVAKTEFEADLLGATIDSVSVEGIDSASTPLVLKARLTSNSYAQQAGDFIYINPHIFDRVQSNPFKAKERKFPIDYAYLRSQSATINLSLPEGFEIKESIYSVNFSASSNDAIFSRQVETDSNRLKITYKLEIRKSTFDPRRYSVLKDFYARVVASQSQQLVLSRVQQPTQTTPPATTKQKKAKK